MALSFTDIATDASISGENPYTWTLAALDANSEYYLGIYLYGGAARTVSDISGFGATFAVVDADSVSDGVDYIHYLLVYRVYTGASPSGDTLTLTLSNTINGGGAVLVKAVEGAASTPTNVQGNEATTGTSLAPSPNLSAMAAGSGTVLAVALYPDTVGDITSEGGSWVSHTQCNADGVTFLRFLTLVGEDVTPTASWTSDAAAVLVAGFEVGAAVAASPSLVSRHHPRGIMRGVMRGLACLMPLLLL